MLILCCVDARNLTTSNNLKKKEKKKLLYTFIKFDDNNNVFVLYQQYTAILHGSILRCINYTETILCKYAIINYTWHDKPDLIDMFTIIYIVEL